MNVSLPQGSREEKGGSREVGDGVLAKHFLFSKLPFGWFGRNMATGMCMYNNGYQSLVSSLVMGNFHKV